MKPYHDYSVPIVFERDPDSDSRQLGGRKNLHRIVSRTIGLRALFGKPCRLTIYEKKNA